MASKYITVDLDWPTVYEIVRSWHRVRRVAGTPVGRVSASGHGIHIKSDTMPMYPVPEHARERRHCGDDSNRIYGDRTDNREANQVLFDHKAGSDAGPWVETLDRLVAEYRRSCNKTPTQHALRL